MRHFTPAIFRQQKAALTVVLEEWRMGYNNVIKIEASEGAKRVIDVLTSLTQNGGGLQCSR